MAIVMIYDENLVDYCDILRCRKINSTLFSFVKEYEKYKRHEILFCLVIEIYFRQMVGSYI